MPLREADHLEAAKNQLKNKRDRLIEQLKELEDQIRSIEAIRRQHFTTGGDGRLEVELPPLLGRSLQTGFASLTDNIWRYFEESREGTPAEVYHYLKSIGYQAKYGYSAAYEALKKLAERGLPGPNGEKLVRMGKKFKRLMPGEVVE